MEEGKPNAAYDSENNVKTLFGLWGPKMLAHCAEHGINNNKLLSEVDESAADILEDMRQLQEQAFADGTTSVVLLAKELLKKALILSSTNMCPTFDIISGYRLACKEACRYIQQNLIVDVKTLGQESVVNAAKTAIHGEVPAADADFLVNMVVHAAESVKIVTMNSSVLCAVRNINILTAYGAIIEESKFVLGYVMDGFVACEMVPTRITNAKIACLNFSLQKHSIVLDAQLIHTRKQVRQRELDITREIIENILSTGANVIMSTGNVDDVWLHHLVTAHVLCIQRCKQRHLVQLAKATGATLLSSFINKQEEEPFEGKFLGEADEVLVTSSLNEQNIIVRGPKYQQLNSVILFGPNDLYCDQLKRSLHKALLVVKRVLESQKVVAGGGSIEAALFIHLEKFSTSLNFREQLIIKEYSSSMLVIPKTLEKKAELEAACLTSKLVIYHRFSQNEEDLLYLKWCGLNLIDNLICDNMQAGIIEPAPMKIQALESATEAAIDMLALFCSATVNSENKSSAEVNEDDESWD